MEYERTFKNIQEKAIEKELNRLTAFGIEEFQVTSLPKSGIDNEDIKAEKNNSMK